MSAPANGAGPAGPPLLSMNGRDLATADGMLPDGRAAFVLIIRNPIMHAAVPLDAGGVDALLEAARAWRRDHSTIAPATTAELDDLRRGGR